MHQTDKSGPTNMSSDTKKTLMTNPPLIDTYNFYANATAIMPDDPRAWDWLHNNFIEIYYCNKSYYFENSMLIYNVCPWLHTYYIPEAYLKRWDSLESFITENIDNDHYLYFFTDRYFLPNFECYMKYHFTHQIFITGYDLNAEEIYYYDVDDIGKYTFFTSKFADVTQAYQAIPDGSRSIYVLKVKKEFIYEFDIEIVINSLNNYLNSKTTTNIFYYEHGRIYGLAAIENLASQVMQVCGKERVDYRGFYLLYEHKMLMSKRLGYLLENEYLTTPDYSSTYKTLGEQFLACRNMVLKYNMTYNRKTLDKIHAVIADAIETEKETLRRIIDELGTALH